MADADKKIVKVLKVGAGYNIVQYEDNSVARRTGTFAARNNNPGNLQNGSFTRSMGALDLSQVEIDRAGQQPPPRGNPPERFAVFPTYAMGREAKRKLLFEYSTPVGAARIVYKNSSIETAITTYAPPNENPTENYITSVVAALNPASPTITRNTVLNKLTPQQQIKFIDAIEREESGRRGSVGSSPTTYVPGQSGTPISGGTSALVGVGEYIQQTYVVPIESKNQAQLQPFVDALKTGTDFLVEKIRNGLYSDTQLNGELQLIGIMQGINDTLASEAKSNLTKIDGLIPAEAAFLVQKNLFEMSPDIMRQQMSANADTSGRVVDYSHAWRAPGKLAITADLMVPGISGLRIGQIFWVGRTYEHYKDYGAFQLFGLTENITIGRGWTTTIHSRFNAMPTQKIQSLRSRSV